MVRDAAIRARIVAEARREFLAHGLRRVTMEELARELGLSKKTLYAHFPSKEALLEAVLRAKLAEVDADLARIVADPRLGVRELLVQLLACADRHARELQGPFVRDLPREAPDLFPVVEKRRRAIVARHFGVAFRRGRAAGVIRRDLSTRLMIEVLTRALDAVVNPRTVQELRVSPRAALNAVLRLFLDGALTPRRTRR